MILSFLFPPRCAVCRKLLPYGSKPELCDDCGRDLPRISDPRCQICGRPMDSEFAMPWCQTCSKGRPFEKCFVPFLYDRGVRRLISNMKYYGQPSKARFLAGEIAREMGGFRPDAITFVPQSSATDRVRGYNQTRLIAKELGRLLDVPVRPALRHSPGDRHQVGLSSSERRKNARGMYLPGKKRLSGTWLLVDDVTTTGSTLDVCCRLLKAMGCDRVYAATAAIRDGKKF